jgi:hypothetical protein
VKEMIDKPGQMWWHTPVTLRRLREQVVKESRPGYKERPHLKKISKNKQTSGRITDYKREGTNKLEMERLL